MDIAKLHLHWGERRYKGKTYRSYSLARAYREHGKSRKEIVLKLGKLTEPEVQRWQHVLLAAKQPQKTPGARLSPKGITVQNWWLPFGSNFVWLTVEAS